MDEFHFPAYGVFARGYQQSIDSNALPPPNWKHSKPSAEREAEYILWRDDIIALINTVLWPSWDSVSSKWLNPDHQKMIDLTEVDFRNFDVLQHTDKLSTFPDSPGKAASIPSHLQYFQDEDSSKFGEKYYFYDTTLPLQQLGTFIADMRNALKIYCGSTSLQIKQVIQRPRAYQVAQLMGIPHKYELAATSMTSSMSSGHCFEGILIGAGIYDQWLDRGFVPTSVNRSSLQQFAADIGDRRVFAGVHYPSDNMASWIMALTLAADVFNHKETSTFVAEAITEHSAIWKLIKDSQSEPYSEAVSAIEKLVDQCISPSPPS